MTLSEKQCIFTLNMGKLIIWTYAAGYELSTGDAYRDPRLAELNAQQGKGIANSLHSRRLAIDFNLFKDGVYQPQSSSYRPLGDFWKTLDPLNRWGGDFRPMSDGNHFSMEDGGTK